MASFLVNAFQAYDKFMERRDDRTDGYPLMNSPIPSLVLTFTYIFLVNKALPAFMEKRKPMNIKNLMLVYNFCMVALSGYIFSEFALTGWFVGYSFGCQPVDYSKSPQALRMVRVCYLFYVSKFIEFFDTIFFILRKKFNQVSFLHVFHHAIMPFSWWVGIKFVPGGFGTFHALLNSFIHFLMYIYYGMAALGPQYQKYLWWKKYMTAMQMIQFTLVVIHSSQLFFIECNYPVVFAYWILAYAVIFLAMFANFYRQAYGKPKHTTKTNGHVANGIKTE